MIDFPTRPRVIPLALAAAMAIGLGACSKSDEGAPATAAAVPPSQMAAAPVTPASESSVAAAPPTVAAPGRGPVVVAQNDDAYAQGRRDQQRQDAQRARAARQAREARELPPRADRDADLPPPNRPQQVAAAVCRECGVVETITPVKVQGQTDGIGAVAGGVGGALVGNRIAGGGNRTLGGVVGAVGGGLLGNAIEKHQRTTTVYDVNVRMDDGTLRTVRESTSPALGEKVRVEADGLHDRG